MAKKPSDYGLFKTRENMPFIDEELEKLPPEDLEEVARSSEKAPVEKALAVFLSYGERINSAFNRAVTNVDSMIQSWNTWIEQYQDNIFATFRRLEEGLKQYELTVQKASKVLEKYKWFITPSLPHAFIFQAVKIGRKKGNQKKAMNRLFIDYFSSNNYETLSAMVDGWENNSLFKRRMKIFRDCISVLQNAKRNTNPSNLVLPTLIAQVDGIQTDYLLSKGFKVIKKNNRVSWEDPSGNKISKKLMDERLKTEAINQVPILENLIHIANEVLFNILFQTTYTTDKASSTFSRHKIMHGEYVTYGRMDNTIRAFLILDFLAALK